MTDPLFPSQDRSSPEPERQKTETGTLYGTGIGPGDPELITLKAWRRLQQVDVIAYPAPEEGDSLARRIAAPHLPDGREEVALHIPFHPDPRHAEAAYDRAAALLAGVLASGKDVALLCEGDPFFYGSFMYIFGRLCDRFPIEIIPGISSLMACASLARRPLVSRNECLMVSPATLSADALQMRIRMAVESGDALVFMKLGRHFPKLRALLQEAGLWERAIYVERAGQAGEFFCPATAMETREIPYFAMLLIPAAAVAFPRG